jgi:hypothetical protein
MEWLLVALALWKDGQQAEARRWYGRAKEAMERNEPVYFYEIGVLGHRQLMEEAAQMMDDETMSGKS